MKNIKKHKIIKNNNTILETNRFNTSNILCVGRKSQKYSTFFRKYEKVKSNSTCIVVINLIGIRCYFFFFV